MLSGSELWLLRLMADRGLALLDASGLLVIIEERGELRVAASSGEGRPRLAITRVQGTALGAVYLAGEPLAKGLRESDRLEPPLFSPATKADEGHDENIPVDRMRSIIGGQWAGELERLSREVYEAGRAIALERGIIIADTKFEFGRVRSEKGAEKVILVDEVLTPDSSRFWPADVYEPGHGQPSFDKQPLRDYLEGEKRAGRWNGNYPPPRLPKEVIDATAQRYLDIYRRLTGRSLNTDASH